MDDQDEGLESRTFAILPPHINERTEFVMQIGENNIRRSVAFELWSTERDINDTINYGEFLTNLPHNPDDWKSVRNYMMGKPTEDEINNSNQNENGNEVVAVPQSPYRGGIYGSDGANVGIYSGVPYTHWSPALRSMLYADEANEDYACEFWSAFGHMSFKIYQKMYNRDTGEKELRPSNWINYQNRVEMMNDWRVGEQVYAVYYPMWERLEEWKHDLPVGLTRAQLLLRRARMRANEQLYAPPPINGKGYRNAKRKFEYFELFADDSDTDSYDGEY